MNTEKLRKEGKPHGNPHPKNNASQMKKKRHVLRNFVLHSKMVMQSVELLLNEILHEDFVEDVKVCMDLMNPLETYLSLYLLILWTHTHLKIFISKGSGTISRVWLPRRFPTTSTYGWGFET